MYREWNLFGRLRQALVHTQTTNALGRRPRPYSTYSQPFRPGAGNMIYRVSWYARFTRARSNNLSTQLSRTRISSTVSPPVPATVCSGPQTTGKFGENTSGDDCTPHRAGKNTKSSGNPGLSTANTFIPCESAISSCGPTSISAIATTAFDKSCKWPKKRHFIEADIQQPHICSNILEYKKQKTRIGEQSCIVQP